MQDSNVRKRDAGYAHVQVPDDFPRSGGQNTLPGAQPKLNAEYRNGRFVVGPSLYELQMRYTVCLEYTKVLPEYCLDLHARHPDWKISKVLEHTGRSLARRHQRMSGLEIDWIIEKLAVALDWELEAGVLWRGRSGF
ncbi:hypothetical protein [Paracidovorax konjaci]|uniref:hypothetical protein n=1 Tax=Paracidovorax konjaci TaxID=32040 RepID=UPI001113CEE6|nr:hypothetical protein [Paracidovorax konjaci]